MGIQSFGLKTIGIKRAKIVSFSWLSYWKSQDNFYELWKVTGSGSLVGLIKGDILTVGGTTGSYTFKVPDEVAYSDRDTDSIFFDSGLSQRTATEAELVGYDFTKTIVFYSDTSPYSIIGFGILDTGQSVNDKMRDDFHLSIWWDDILNDYGYTKGNRGNKKSYWKDTAYEVEVDALIARMVALGEEPDSDRKTVLNNTFITAKTKAFFTKAPAIWLLASHAEGSSRLNIIKNDHNCTLLNTPDFTANDSWYFNGSDEALKTDFIPSTDGAGILGLNSVGIFIYEKLLETTDRMVMGCSTSTSSFLEINNKRTNRVYSYVNSNLGLLGTVGSFKFAAATRNSSVFSQSWGDDTPTIGTTDTSVSLPAYEFYIGGYNRSGVLNNPKECKVALAGITAGLSQMDIWDIIEVFVTGYLTTIGAE